ALRRLQADAGELRDVPRIVRIVADEIEIADDDRQQVVEVVGDAAGHLADRLELLDLAKLLLQLAPVLDVDEDAEVSEIGAVGAEARHHGVKEPAINAVLAAQPIFVGGRGAAREDVALDVRRMLPVVGMDAGREAAAKPLLERPARERRPLLVEEDAVALV